MMSSLANVPHPNLVIGCGYLGRRVAAAWRATGRRVAALTRNRAGELATLGLDPVLGDVTEPTSLAALPAASTVLYAVGMDRSSGKSMRDVYVAGLANVLTVLRPPNRFIYVSSTSVYGQTDGREVDECSQTEPIEESGRIVREAELMLQERHPNAIILRFAGIYGPDRVLRKQAILNGEPLIGDADKWLNLIHVADGVQAVLAAESQGRPGEIYNIADDHPVRRRDFYTFLAELLGGRPAHFESPPAAKAPPEANRRISNRKARTELGFVPAFPSYRAGLPNAVKGDSRR
jgi:nucleoside-diphosphate-sugar epimerase